METELKTDMALLKQDMEYLKKEMSEIKDMLKSNDKKYASKMTERIVYGMVTLILSGAVIAILKLVFK